MPTQLDAAIGKVHTVGLQVDDQPIVAGDEVEPQHTGSRALPDVPRRRGKQAASRE